MNKFYEAACAYAEAGRPVLPLKAGDKSPITLHGVKDATTNLDQIRKWWTQFPDANVGIAVGHEVFGLDIDYKDGADKDFLKRIPVTAIVKSPSGGHHAYFKLPEGGIKNGLVVEKGVTVRSSGYYFAAPPSFYTKTASTYEWDSKPIYSGEIAECPEWILEINNQVSEEKKAYKLPEQINEGERNTNFWKLACSLRAKGLEENEIVAGLIAANERTNPKVPLEELEDFAKRACGYQKGVTNKEDVYDSIETEWVDKSKEEKEKEIAEWGGTAKWALKHVFLRILKESKINEVDISKEDKKEALKVLKRIFFTSETPYNMAQNFIKDCGFIDDNGSSLIRYYRDDFYRYKDSSYQKLDDEWIKDRINRWMIDNDWKKFAGTEKVEKVLNILRTKPQYVGRQIELPAVNESADWMGDWKAAQNIIPMKNGLFDVKNEKLLNKSPRYFFSYELPFEYNPSAVCPIFDKVCQEIFSSEEEILMFEEIMGVHVYRPFLIEKMILLYGQGANGKSVMTTILEAILGTENVSNVPIDCFNSSNFTFVDTLGKIANIIPDMKDIDSIDEGTLKAYVSGEPMHFNRKNKPAVRARPTAIITACTNVLPKFSDKSDGLWRRMILIEFKKQFKKENQKPEYRDPNFWKKELPGIFNKIIKGAKRVEKRGSILEVESSKQIIKEYRKELNFVEQFAEEFLMFDELSKCKSKDIYKSYCSMVIESGGKPLGAPSFSRQLKITCEKMGKKIAFGEGNERIGTYVGRVWHGCQIKVMDDDDSLPF